MSSPCDGMFHFAIVEPDTMQGGGLVIPFANGVHVALSNEDYNTPSDHLRAYVYSEKDKNLHWMKGAPSNREMDGEDVLKLLNWAANLPADAVNGVIK